MVILSTDGFQAQATAVLGGTLIVNFPTVFSRRIGSEVGIRGGRKVVGADDIDAALVSGCWMDDGICKWITFGLG